MPLTDFLSESEQRQVVSAIETAERCTSGEIRVHVEPSLPRRHSPMQRAVEVFDRLEMYRTRERNAVLVYVAYRSHHLAIVGDTGINERVPEGFWQKELDMLAGYLRRGESARGLSEAIGSIGERLAAFFPPSDNDINEQSDEISFSE